MLLSERVGGFGNRGTVVGSSNTVGRCGEFHVRDLLEKAGSMPENIRFIIPRRPYNLIRFKARKPMMPCNICKEMGFTPYEF